MNASNATKERISDEIYNVVQATVQRAHVVDGLDIVSAQAVVDIADTVLGEIEKLQADDLTPEDKKDIATTVISRLININISFIPNFVEDKAKAYIVRSVIEFAVSWINKKLGKDILK